MREFSSAGFSELDKIKDKTLYLSCESENKLGVRTNCKVLNVKEQQMLAISAVELRRLRAKQRH